MSRRITCAFGIAMFAACGSDSEDVGVAEDAPLAPVTASAEPESARQPLDLWSAAVAQDAVGIPARDPAAPLDADAVIARFERECGGGLGEGECPALRRDLELVFFADLLGLKRAGQRLDRELARAAARARLPQLACFGLRELLIEGKPTKDDVALISAALDSPWRAQREIVRLWGRRLSNPVPGLADLFERDAGPSVRQDADLCLDGGKDPEPNPGLAGHYPGARHRAFASTADLRWFTTPDPPERVLAFLTKNGGEAYTAEGLKARQQAIYLEEMTRLSSAEGAPDATAAMMQLMFEASRDWSAPFARLDHVAEIRYVMIAPSQAIAVFHDEALHATAIVAPRPAHFDPKALGL
jgi:hypothetical protein